MKERSLLLVSILALSLACVGLILGPALLGSQVRQGMTSSADKITSAHRQVTVRGLSEREIPANLVLWPVVFQVQAQRLDELQQSIDGQRGQVIDFLLNQGFDREQIRIVPPTITDREQNIYGEHRPSYRFGADVVVLVRTDDARRVSQAMRETGTLVTAGVALTQSYEHRPQFLFTELETVKPDMVAEATRDARRAAEQFAQDSGSRVGGILTATQGLFSIEDLDSYTPEIKKVRVVTTISFKLETP
ncbi:SIMPL domain-containing protein [Ectothiorhodospira lacustris]|uniref:SIMPL domain-containing protein n=1 Tax=Ectothiorhodospira lacustris TaxID=2899127 RepID=UPI001EE8A791|nr:SIMPL domain-containing protein [Ectothiorhodospira lacustris]MCG5501627.1 SIMPL domain-containing protein [Ectothiorhodospira lacustris]MCG5511447.1 SIMPL domain-containing protein [Ectothiorhodospira lacustris]MCG5523233.1 SIMPL domain-containing protein [Ectothiorhodospira lacustris]